MKSFRSWYNKAQLSEVPMKEGEWFLHLMWQKALYILLTVLLSLLIAFLFNKYSRPVYEIKAYFLMEESLVENQRNNIGLPISSGFSETGNQKQWMRSFPIARQTVKSLGWEVFYYKKNQFLTRQIEHKKVPFRIVFDSSHQQITGNRFNVYAQDSASFRISLEAEHFTTYHYQRDEVREHEEATVSLDTIIVFGDQVETEFFKFRLERGAKEATDRSGVYQFQFNDLNVLADRYKMVRIEPVEEEASLMKVFNQSAEAKFLSDYINALMQYTMQKEIENKRRSLERSIAFLNNRLQHIGDSLQDTRQKLIAFQTKRSQTFYQKIPDHKLDKLSSRLREKAKHILRIKQIDYALSRLQREPMPEVFSFSVFGKSIIRPQLTNRLIKLYEKRQSIRYNAKKDLQGVKKIDHQIHSLKQQIVEQLLYKRRAVKATTEQLEKDVKQITGKLNQYPEIEKQETRLARNFELLNQYYTILLKKQLDLKISSASVTADSQIVDKASLKRKEPVYPKVWLNYLIAFLLGLGAPIGYFYVSSQLDTKVRSETDLENRLAGTKILGRLFHNDKDTNLVTSRYPLSRITESIRTVRSRLDLLPQKNKGRVILVSSVLPGEGKTFVSINLSLAYALKNKKTILLGFDLRKPKIFSDFNVHNTRGLTNYLANQYEWQELVQHSEYHGLDLLMAGPIPPNPA
ncbi:MAG: hypothetical protein K9I68_10480 [Bacteroidales bacterium]|nr:hypothetical protein [Bacteroidales bacterium]MCF8338438.1 hypothetical protein [Bacteroidales bacterium]